MYFCKITGSLLMGALVLGMANAAVIENIKASAEGAKKVKGTPKVIEVDGQKAFCSNARPWQVYSLMKKIKVNPEKKYVISAKIKQFGEKPAYVWIGFLPYNAKGRSILSQHGFYTTKGSFTSLASAAVKGAKTITLKDASKWNKKKHYYVAFKAKKDMSDIPNFDVSDMISKIDKTGDVYTVTLKYPLKKAYPAGTMVRQHRSAGTYIYMKSGKAPAEWTVWKGKPAQGKILRKATFIRPMVMINVKKGSKSGALFTDFMLEEL